MIHSLMTDTLRNNPPECAMAKEVEDLANPAIDKVAAMAADLAIESAGSTGGPEYMPRHPSYTQ
jgi:hypothetical protein